MEKESFTEFVMQDKFCAWYLDDDNNGTQFICKNKMYFCTFHASLPDPSSLTVFVERMKKKPIGNTNEYPGPQLKTQNFNPVKCD